MDILAGTFLAAIIAMIFYGAYFLISSPLWIWLDKIRRRYKIPEWKVTTFIGYPLFLFTLWLFIAVLIKLADYFGIS